MKLIPSTILIPTFLVVSFQLFADWPLEERKINFLLSEIAQLEAVFIRNGSEHEPDEAVAHLRMKLERAQNSWFAPAREKWSAEMFIEKIASKSSISGDPYLIKFKDGKIVPSGKWLRERLESSEAIILHSR